MRKTSQYNDHQPRDPRGSDYWEAIYRYLGFLGLVCLIAGLRAGPVLILVWLAAAYVLTRDPEQQNPKPRHRPCNPTKRRRC